MEQEKHRLKDRQRQVELLAPAGSREAFYGAVHAGADAVYLGGEKFGARAYADNFTTEELLECIRYGHIYGCRSYLTVNTLMKEQELKELVEALTPLYEVGLDGVIVQDIGALQVIRQHFPGLELHASTQMTITGPAGAALLKELGVTRVVPARELNLQELIQLKAQSGLEVETFIHGAMCYCYSGACLFSSLLGGRSGNRGRCAQPCRLAYGTDSPGAAVHRKEYYPLSLKDMCTIEHLPELIEAGIDSLKIEGRMKKPEYAAGVTAIYRKYIDRYLASPQKPFSVEQQDLDALSGLYIRSRRQDGYYFKQNGREMVTLDSPSYNGSDEEYLKQLRRKYIEEKKRTGVWMKAVFVCGRQAKISMGAGECRAELCGSPVEPAQNHPILETDIRRQLQKLGDSCFALESLEIQTDERGFYSLKEINVLRREAVRLLEDQMIAGHGLTVRRKSQAALTLVLPGGVAESVRERAMTCRDTEAEEMMTGHTAKENALPNSGLRIHISTEEQLHYLAEHLAVVQENAGKQGNELGKKPFVRRLYVESHLLRDSLDYNAGIPLWVALPYILRSKDEKNMEQALELYRRGKIQGFLVRNLEEYGWLVQREESFSAPQAADTQGHPTQLIQLDHTIYMWNSRTADFWRRKNCGLTCPLELNGREWRALFQQTGDIPEKLVYGRIPVMVTANCIAKTAGKCLQGQAAKVEGAQALCVPAHGTLTDRYQKKFPVELRCDVCMNVIYNSVPLSLHKDWERFDNVHKRLSFTTESGEEMVRILRFFTESTSMRQQKPPFEDYTTGHEKRGVL